MNDEQAIETTFDLQGVRVVQGRLLLEGQVRLELPLPRQDPRLPYKVEQNVEDAGQQFKRWVFRQVLEKLDAELLLTKRSGKDGQGVVCRGTRAMTFKTLFGTIVVARRRIEHKSDGSTEVPAAEAWGTPQQETITQGLGDAACDAMLKESSRNSLRSIEERAGEAGLLGRVTVLNLLHAEGRELREATRLRAKAVFDQDAEAVRRLLPHVAEPTPEEIPSPQPEEQPDLWEALTGFPGAPTAEVVSEDEPRRVDPQTVMVQADDVSVKAQASTGCKEIHVSNAMVRTSEQTWHFSEESAQKLIYVVGALLATLGVPRGERRLLFVNDGARWIRDWFEGLQVNAKGMVLCWYHLSKRCLQDLGMACGRKRAEEIGKEVLGHLWEGRVDEGLEVLARCRPEMKNRPALDQLVEYLRNRRPYLPCYRARRESGLWIASNRVEKLNDWAVSHRCKHQGMDWTRDGVVALAVLEASRRNGELPIWRSERCLPAWQVKTPVQQAA